MIRLNKLLADRGLGARRKCDEMIQSGAVRVNGTVVTEPGTQVEPGRDRVEVNGRPLPRETALITYMLHKPVGVISTLSDPEGRRSLRDFMPAGARLFPVGRLDADSSGLLLLTNDGDLAHHLMHPRYGVAKRYRVHLDRTPSESQLRRLQDGVEFEPGVTSSPAQVWARDSSGDEAVIEIAIHEGRHRQVRRMCEAVGLTVKRLHRYGYGPLKLGELERGLWRELSEAEVDSLRAASARPAARSGGFTGQRSFDRPRVRPRQDRSDRRPAREGFAGRGGGDAHPRRERSGPGGRGDERPRRDREEGREHGWGHPPTRVWRAEDEGKEKSGGAPRERSDRGRPSRPRTGAFGGREWSEGRRPRPEGAGPRTERGSFERRPARSSERPARAASDRAPARSFERPSGGGFERSGGRGGPREGARREGFGAGPRGRDRGGFAPRAGGRTGGGFTPRPGGRTSGGPRTGSGGRTGGGFTPRSGGGRTGGGFAPRSGGSRTGGGFAPRAGGSRSGGFSPRGGGRPDGPRGGGRGGFAPRGRGDSGDRRGFSPRGRTGQPGEGASPARRSFERSPRPERTSRGGFPPRNERGGAGRPPRGARPGERRGAPRSGNSTRSRPPRRPNS